MLCHLWYFPETTAAPVITSVPTSTSDMLGWSHHPDCTNDYTFQFSIIWVSEDGLHDGMSSGNFTTDANKYDFIGLPRGNYSITIKAQCIEYAFIVSEPVNVNIRLTCELVFEKYMCLCVCVCVCTYAHACVCIYVHMLCLYMCVCKINVHICNYMYT